MSTLLEAGFSEDRAATVYHMLGAYTLGLGYARLLGDEVQTTRHRRPARRPLGRLPQPDARRHAPRRVGPAGRVRDRAGRAARPLRRPAGRARVTAARRRIRARPLRVKMISPAKTAADSRFWRSIKYSLFPPLGLATLAGYLDPDDEIDLQDEHVETLRPRRRARPRRHRGLHHLRRPRLPLRRPLPRPRRLRLPRRPAPDEPAGGGRPARRQRLLRAGRGHLAGVPRATSAPAGPRPLYRSTERTLAGLPAGAPRPHQARALPRAQLAGREPRLPARLRLLLQGGVLPRRQVVLRAGGRRGAGRDRPPPRPPPLLPRRQPLRQPAVRRGALRRPQGDGPPVAGGRHGARPCSAPACSRRRWRAGCAACSSASRR